MKHFFLTPFLLVALAFTFAACEETTEPTAYDNWRERNDAFLDSLAAIAGENYLVWRNPETRATTNVPDMNVGELYAVEVQSAGTNVHPYQYIYAKKLVDNPQGTRVLYTDNVDVYYYGTLINGESFDGNFEGYGALDQQIPLDPEQMKWPTPFDEPALFNVKVTDGVVGVIAGFSWALQMSRTGERWVIYIPYNVGYGGNDNGSIPAYSVLTFDFILEDIVEDAN